MTRKPRPPADTGSYTAMADYYGRLSAYYGNRARIAGYISLTFVAVAVVLLIVLVVVS